MNSHAFLVLAALLRRDFLAFLQQCFATLLPGEPFAHNWHLEHLSYLLGQVTAGEERRLIVNVPPRSLKSISISVAYTAFRLGHDPSLKIIVVSHSAELARKHARDFRQIVDSPWYRAVFPAFRIGKNGDRLFEVISTQNGSRLATSVGASVTGKGANLIIIDDPNKAQDVHSEARRGEVNTYYDQTLYSRLDNKQRDSIILVMQRLHADDLVGHVLEKDDWTVAAIPAIEIEDRSYRLGSSSKHVYFRRAGEILHPHRDNQEVLDRNRAVLGSLAFQAQYQQDPIPPDGNVIKRSWLRYYDVPPETFDFVVASWDTATTLEESSDYSAGTVWGLKGSNCYLLEVIRGHLDAPDLCRSIEDCHLRWHAHATIIEKANIGHALLQMMRRQSSIRPILISPKYDKTARFIAQSPKFEAGQVFLPREAPWLGIYLAELLAFPNARNDDQVDSTSQALKYLTEKMERTPRAEAIPPVNPRAFRRPSGRNRPSGMNRPTSGSRR